MKPASEVESGSCSGGEPPWNRPTRARLYTWVALDVAFALGWAGFARWIVPPLLVAEHPGRLIQSLKKYLMPPPVLFLNQDPLGRWREFSEAVLFAVALHLTIAVVLSRSDGRANEEGLARDDRAAGRTNLALSLLAAAFLAVTVLSGMFQDYYFYLEIWYHVRHGQDPWFLVFGADGGVPLNAYGPLFNPLAGLAWINPMAPKLLFAFAYLLFATSTIQGFLVDPRRSGLRTLGLIALFWNPFPWVEVAYYGHFDVLVGLACLAAVREWDRGRDIGAGLYLAAGVLLKYLPIVLLPFLAFDPDRGRLRPRFLAAAMLAIVAGLALSTWIWGSSTFLPLKLAATRDARTLSIFRFFRGPYSPLPWFGLAPNLNNLSPLSQLLGLAWAWSWWRARKPGVEAIAVVAVTITVLLYRVGYPQYQMVPFVLTTAWVVRHRDRLRNRTALAVALTAYFGWLAAFDVYYVLVEEWHMDLGWWYMSEVAGIPTLLLGCAFLAAVVRAATPQVPVVATGPLSCSDV